MVALGKITKHIRSICRNTIANILTGIGRCKNCSKLATNTLRIEQELQIQMTENDLKKMSKDELVSIALFAQRQIYIQRNSYERLLKQRWKI